MAPIYPRAFAQTEAPLILQAVVSPTCLRASLPRSHGPAVKSDTAVDVVQVSCRCDWYSEQTLRVCAWNRLTSDSSPDKCMLTQNWVGPKSSSLINSPGQGAGVQSGCPAWECPAGTQWKEESSESGNPRPGARECDTYDERALGPWNPWALAWLGMVPLLCQAHLKWGERLDWSTPLQECLQLNGSNSYSRDKGSKQTSSGLVLVTLLKPITSHHLATQANAPQGPTHPFNPYFLHKK